MDVPPEEETDSNYEDEDDDDDDDDDDYDDEFDEIPGPNDPGIIDEQADDDLVDAILQQGRVDGGVGVEEARARAEIRMHAHLRATIANRRARFDENDGSLLRRTLKLLARVGIHHRVLLIFVIDGLLNKSLPRHVGLDVEDPASCSTILFSLLLFLVSLFLFLIPTVTAVEVMRVILGGYGPICLAFAINRNFVKSAAAAAAHSATDAANLTASTSSPPLSGVDQIQSSSPYAVLFVLVLGFHLDLTLLEFDRESRQHQTLHDLPDGFPFRSPSSSSSSSSPWRLLSDPQTLPLKWRISRACWFFARLASLVSLVSPFLVSSSLLPFVPLASSHVFPGLLVPLAAVSFVVSKRMPSYWRRSASASARVVNWVARNVDNFGPPGILYFIEDQWTRLKLPRVLRTFFLLRIACQCADLFLWTGCHPETGYPLEPASNVLTLFRPGFFDAVGAKRADDDRRSSSSASSVFNVDGNSTVVAHSTLLNNNNSLLPFSADSFLSIALPSRRFCPASTPSPPSSIAFSPSLILLVNSADTCCALMGFSSWISLVTFYLGRGIQTFLGLENDDPDQEEGGNMGVVGSVLFFILGVQTGLTSMEPEKRLVRLCKNFSLLVVALLHYVHSLVHPQLESLSLPASRYARTFVVCAVLVCFPLGFICFLWSRFSASTWLFAVTVFGLELIIKVVLSLAVFVLFQIDANTDDVWEPLDDYIYWVRAVGSGVEFLFAVFLFCNGAWIMLFESGGSIRAVMMCIHAYYNIWQQARVGWDKYKKRRQSVNKIDSMSDASAAQLERHQDVCSICYNDLATAKVTVCHHFFHASCLKKWLYLQDNCPMCHRNIFDSNADGDDDDEDGDGDDDDDDEGEGVREEEAILADED